MKCPNDDTQLAITERQGVEIDYCPQCRGVWLDRGELDKIIDKTQATHNEPVRYSEPERRDYRRDNYGHEGHYKKKKRESFLGDLFDF